MSEPEALISRRQFVIGAVAVGAAASGGMLLGYTAATGVFNVFLEITPDNVIWITGPQSEMGQGVHDGLPKILAEELDADWSLVQVRLPTGDDRFVNPLTKRQRTANSDSTIMYFELLRKVGAIARAMLVSAAAKRWSVAAAECTAALSEVKHVASGRSATFGALAGEAALTAPPTEVWLKLPSEFKLIGTSTLRKDTPAKTDGSAVFGIDVRLPGMLYAALRRAPQVQSKLVRFDRDAALQLPGVVDAFEIPDGVAVVARSTWQARQAAERLSAVFDSAASADVLHEGMRARLLTALGDDAAALPGRPAFGGRPYDRAATLAALGAGTIHEWHYEVPYLAHAALEPLCATALVRDDSCEVWVPTQQPDRARDVAAKESGVSREHCKINVTFLGGGFGRKWEVDFVRQAVQIAAHVKNTPVKLTWTREQDFQHDRYRPAHRVRTRVAIGADGSIQAMHSRISGISMWKYQGRTPFPGVGDLFALGLLINDKYQFPNKYTDYVETPFPVPVGTWRSVSASMNGFFGESAIDDVAAVTREDPYQLRRKLLVAEPRLLAALNLVAQKAGWDTKLSKGRGRGIAIGVGFDSICAQVIEVTARGKKIKVDRIVCAFDCGTVIDPHNVKAQVESGVIWGLSAARDGQIHFDKGAARETNFHLGPVLRSNQVPKIEVHLIASAAKPGGAGEAGVPPVAPALASAIFMATGSRPRRLPIIESGFTFE